MKTYIVGHKNPDTDSIVSAIGLSVLEHGLDKPYLASSAGEINKETAYLLDRFGFEVPEMIPAGEKKVILVDHNEQGQMHENVDLSEIQFILDHHKLGGLSLSNPISVRIKPVGSTATLVANLFVKKGVKIEPNVAGILLGGVLSDTLNLTSPTTTDEDREVVKSLVGIANVDATELSSEMFKAKSDISDIPTEELIGKDYKVFDLCERKVGIGVWETVLPQTILDRKDEIMEFLAKKKVDEALDYIFFTTVDIVDNKSVFFILGDEEKELAEAVFGGDTTGSTLECPGIVSRKKQIVPPIEEYLAK